VKKAKVLFSILCLGLVKTTQFGKLAKRKLYKDYMFSHMYNKRGVLIEEKRIFDVWCIY
jgi:hypothetical protein